MSNNSSPQSQPKNAIDSTFSIEKLPITVNGVYKVATGLTKQTTMGDIKYAMLSVTDANFSADSLSNFAVFEKWQGNERMLDDQTKIFKLIRLWRSLPGDQLQHVKFFIKAKKRILQQAEGKSRIYQHNLKYQDMSVASQVTHAVDAKSKYEFCTLSPDLQKTWNYERIKRNNNKSSYIKKQLLIANNPSSFEKQDNEYGTSNSISSRDSSASSNASASTELNQRTTMDRYASIKRTNRSRKSTVQKVDEPKVATIQHSDLALKESFINLVNMQNQLINKQNSQLKSETENAEMSEYLQVYNSYFSAQFQLNEKLEEIQMLRNELDTLKSLEKKDCSDDGLLLKASRNLATSISIKNQQKERMSKLDGELARLDDIIQLKQPYLDSLHEELDILEELSIKENSLINVKQLSANFLDANNNETTSQKLGPVTKLNVSSDNESDTGISSVTSEDLSNRTINRINQGRHLETLV
jgi:hypothetical protein